MKAAHVLVALLLLSGCGYHTTGSTATKLPSDIHTIAIPAFINKTPQYKVEQLLTQAVVREFVSRTNASSWATAAFH